MRPVFATLMVLLAALAGGVWGAPLWTGLLVVAGKLHLGGGCGNPFVTAAMVGSLGGGCIGGALGVWLSRAWHHSALADLGFAGFMQALRKLGVLLGVLVLVQIAVALRVDVLARLATGREARLNVLNIAGELERSASADEGYAPGTDLCPATRTYETHDTIPALGLAIQGRRYQYTLRVERDGTTSPCTSWEITATGRSGTSAKGMTISLDSAGNRSGPWR